MTEPRFTDPELTAIWDFLRPAPSPAPPQTSPEPRTGARPMPRRSPPGRVSISVRNCDTPFTGAVSRRRHILCLPRRRQGPPGSQAPQLPAPWNAPA